MSDSSWGFRTTQGAVTVGGDAIRIRSTPRAFLAGQRARWRNGTAWERAKILFFAVSGLWSLVQVATIFDSTLDVGPVGVAGLSALGVLLTVVGLFFWLGHEITIPRSAVETVALEEDDRTLTIVYESTGRLDALARRLGLRSIPLSDGRSKQTHTLPADSDVQDAREILRLRGIALDSPDSETGTETSYRVDVERGVCFYEDCGSQVSPTDSDCPSCGYALNVAEGARQPSIEYATD